MVNSFTATPDLSGFTALPAAIDLMTKNPAPGYGATVSAAMDFSDYDRADEDALNRVLWHSIKGADGGSLPSWSALSRGVDGATVSPDFFNAAQARPLAQRGV